MAKPTWIKWYPGDFILGTRRLTPDMGWLYTVVLNWIYESGAPIDDDIEELAAASNMKPSRAEAALEALVKKGKLSRINGKISNARAAEEIASRASSISKSSEAATRRWENQRKKDEENQPQKVETHVHGTSNPSESRVEENKKRKKESSSPRKATVNGVQYTDEFELKVWGPYPRKRGTSKHKPFQLWQMLNDVNRERVIAAIPLHAQQMKLEGRAEDKIMHLQTFINQRVYETYSAISAESNVVQIPWHKTATRDQWARALKIYEMDSNWRNAWGPKPGYDGCTVPPDLIDTLPYHLHPKSDPQLRSQSRQPGNPEPEAV